MDKALVTEFTTLKLQQIVQLLATDLTKKNAVCCAKKYVNVDKHYTKLCFFH